MKKIRHFLVLLCGILLASVPVFGEDSYPIVEQDALSVGRMQLISSSRKALNSYQGPQQSFSYQLPIIPQKGQLSVTTISKTTSGYTPYFILTTPSPGTCFYLSPPGSPNTPATDIICASDKMSTPCYFTFLPGYGGGGTAYCLTDFSIKTEGYQPYTVTGFWAV